MRTGRQVEATDGATYVVVNKAGTLRRDPPRNYVHSKRARTLQSRFMRLAQGQAIPIRSAKVRRELARLFSQVEASKLCA